jgi:hypothetical protein
MRKQKVILDLQIRHRILAKQQEAEQKRDSSTREADRQFYVGVVAGISEALIIIDGSNHSLAMGIRDGLLKTIKENMARNSEERKKTYMRLIEQCDDNESNP